MMPLSLAQVGEENIIKRIGGSPEVKRHLENLGFVVGGEVTDYADMLTEARQIAMYLAKQHTKAPLTTIGSAIGGRNHATVLHSCKAVTNLIETDKAFRRQVEEIEKKVLAQ